METKKVRWYWWEKVVKASFLEAWQEAGMKRTSLILLSLFVLLVGIAGIGVILDLVPFSIFNNRLKDVQAGFVALGFSFLVLFTEFALTIYRKPAEIYYDQEEAIDVLENQILEFNKSLEEYDGLVIEKDLDEAYINQYARAGANLSHEIKLWVIVHNTRIPVYDCVIGLENLEYKGHYSNDEWVPSPSDFDRKAMKWDVGYSPNEGKMDISTRTRKRLEVATAYPHPIEKMELSHLDGYSSRGHLLEGKYRATLRIDGRVFVGTVKKDINPRWYEVVFDYQRHSRILKLLEISEYKPPKEAI
jgi:hypothetical protein